MVGLSLYWQPIKPVEGFSLKREGEILLRDQNGCGLPKEFFADAGQMLGVDQWVLAQVGWLLKARQDGHYHVNLTGWTLDKAGFVDEFCKAISAEVRPRLTLEITEQTPLTDQALETVAELRTLCPVLLDDFGQAYASLAHYQRLPVDGFKIDGAIVEAADRDRKAMKIVQRLFQLALDLDQICVAEWVSSSLIWLRLTELKWRYAPGLKLKVQGYAVGKPVPVRL